MKLRILIIEDLVADAKLIAHEIQRAGYDVYYERIEDANAMRRALAQKEWDLILSDYSLPGFSSHEALDILKKSELDIPFIIVSGVIGEDTAVETMKSGAHDYVMKNSLKRLIPAVQRELWSARNRKERKAAEGTLKEQFKIFLQSAPDAIVIVDQESVIEMVNAFAEKMFGYTQAEMLGHKIETLVPRKFPNPKICISGDSCKLTGRRKDGTEFPIEIALSPLQSEQGKQVISIIRDLTVRKQAEDSVRHALKTRDDFLSLISRDFLIERFVKSMDLSQRQFEVLTGLIDELVDVSQLQAGNLELNFEKFNISDFVRETCDRSLQSLKDVGCTVEYDIDPEIIGFWDRDRIEQIITNLISNIIQHASHVPVKISLKDDRKTVVLRFQDFGPGIHTEKREKVWGLGLFMGEQIAKAHYGSFSIVSKPGEGTSVTIKLPKVLDATLYEGGGFLLKTG